MKKAIFITTLGSMLLFGSSLDSQIEALKKAPPHKRFKLMNQIKLQLISLNEAQRNAVIKKLLKSFSQQKMAKQKGFLKGRKGKKRGCRLFLEKKNIEINSIIHKNHKNKEYNNKKRTPGHKGP